MKQKSMVFKNHDAFFLSHPKLAYGEGRWERERERLEGIKEDLIFNFDPWTFVSQGLSG